jgi:nucleoside-diphosphate-sugar epimerase
MPKRKIMTGYITVFGGTGVIGRHLVASLLRKDVRGGRLVACLGRKRIEADQDDRYKWIHSVVRSPRPGPEEMVQ